MNVRYDMVACFVVRPGNAGKLEEVLQLRRAPGEFLEGAWSTVRGRAEVGETAWRAGLRELREETGLAPSEYYQLDTVDVFYLHGDDTLWRRPPRGGRDAERRARRLSLDTTPAPRS